MSNFWYAVMFDEDDWDWGYGSYDIDEARHMLSRKKIDHPDAYIAIIDEGDGEILSAMCIGEINL